MKISIERSARLHPSGTVQSVVERQNTIPILANAMLVAENDSLKIIASDMEIEAQETIATTVIEPGKTTVSASTFYDIVRKLPDGSTVELNLDGGHLEIKAARSRFRLTVLSPADFRSTELRVG